MASSSLQAPAALPSSTSARQWTYDVFLSFRGPDTRKGIISHLYDQLQHRRGIHTFFDDLYLQVGDDISPTILTAIEESRFAIVFLSKDYASSAFCLKELTKICQCMEDGNRILPVFYQFDPTDVRFQKRSFEEALIKHEKSGRYVPEKVQQWRDALSKVASLPGWISDDYNTERLVELIAEHVGSRVQSIEMKKGDFEAFVATGIAMGKLMEALKRESVTAIGVYGIGGVGKTTMVKHVGSQARKNGIFDHVIIAVVSQSPDFRKIQGTLADQLHIKLVGGTEAGRARKLNEEIKKRKKILIVLDDIWGLIDLSAIGIPSYKELENCQSKVILTTRLRKFGHVMRCHEIFRLDILSADDSWTLFVRNAGRSFESTEFVDVARRVVRECCGLPIALIAVAKALGDKDLVEWKKAAQSLEKPQTANPDEGEAFKCIKFSYDYLKDEDYKSFFLLCCLFPEDFDIQIEELFNRALEKGLFRDADTIEVARGTAVSVANHLKSCSLLLDSEEKECVRMHTVIRDAAMLILKSEDGHGFFSSDWIFLAINICLEAFSLAFDQAASFRRPYFALIGMLLAIVALLLSIGEFLFTNKQRHVILEKRSSWTALFGSVPDSFGIAAGFVQSVCSAVQFWYLRHHEENPMKVSLVPAIFLLCLITVKLSKRRQVAREHND